MLKIKQIAKFMAITAIINLSIFTSQSVKADISPTDSFTPREPDPYVAVTCKGLNDCSWLGNACEGIFITWWNDDTAEVVGECDNSPVEYKEEDVKDFSSLSPEEIQERTLAARPGKWEISLKSNRTR